MIAPLAVAGEARGVAAGSAVAKEAWEVATGSAVAREAEQDVVRYKNADSGDVNDGSGPGPTCLDVPKGLAQALGPEDPTSASNPKPANNQKRRIQFAVASEGPNKEYLSEAQEDINDIMCPQSLQSHGPRGTLAHHERR